MEKYKTKQDTGTQDTKSGNLDSEFKSQGLSCFVLFFLSCILCYDAACYTLAVGHLQPLQKGNTFILLTDLSGSGPPVKVSFYDDSGKEVSVAHKLLPPQGKIQLSLEDYLKSAGSIILESPNEQITGEYWQISKTGTVIMVPFQSPGENRYLINCFRVPFCDQSYVVISDPIGTGPMVQMEFYSKTGELIKVARKMLRPHGMLVSKVTDYVSRDVVGKISIRSFGGNIILHCRYVCDKKAVFAIPASAFSRNLIIDKFSAGKQISANLIIMDASAKGTTVRVNFLNSNGELISYLQKPLSSNGVLPIDITEYVNNINNGIIKINSESEIMANYWEKSPDTGPWMDIGNKYPEPEDEYHDLFFSYFPFYDNFQVMLSLLNIDQDSTSIELLFYDGDGKKLGSKKILLEPYKQVNEPVNHYFNESRLGTIIVRESNTRLLVTSKIFDFKSGRFLGKAHAISR